MHFTIGIGIDVTIIFPYHLHTNLNKGEDSCLYKLAPSLQTGTWPIMTD